MPKAGRKRKQGRREPSGLLAKPLHTERAENMTAVALEARERVFGVSAKQAARMPETSFLGRLRSAGRAEGISWAQWQAAKWYEEVCHRYRRLHPVRGYPQPGDVSVARGHDSEEDAEPAKVKAYIRARRAYNRAINALREANLADHRASAVIDRVVLEGYWMPHMLGPLRVGLNELARVAHIDDVDEKEDKLEVA